MSKQDNLTLAKKIYKFFDEGKVEELVNLFSENSIATHIPTNVVFKGRDGFRQATKIWKNAFSNSRCEIKNQIVTDEYIVTEFNGVGTNDGTLETSMGNIGPTGKRVSIPFVEILKIRNGKIENSKLYFDTATMMHQLEVIPEKV